MADARSRVATAVAVCLLRHRAEGTPRCLCRLCRPLLSRPRRQSCAPPTLRLAPSSEALPPTRARRCRRQGALPGATTLTWQPWFESSVRWMTPQVARGRNGRRGGGWERRRRPARAVRLGLPAWLRAWLAATEGNFDAAEVTTAAATKGGRIWSTLERRCGSAGGLGRGSRAPRARTSTPSPSRQKMPCETDGGGDARRVVRESERRGGNSK